MINLYIVLYALLVVLSLLLLIEAYAIYKKSTKDMHKRRRWARIKVPNDKMITCRIVEPGAIAGAQEYLVNDINMAGISFFCDKKLEKDMIRLHIKFPFTTFKEAGLVSGKVAYCNKIPDMEKYRVGIAYIRKMKWSK
ncbi:MAG: hypothetical protein PHH68_02660 [Candidatus Omnitrophica bacterium]|jgi:signal transduction histidine kinase|nr:hypothetical protein [Candidatus Omnitrophota bacterium]MDD5079207.1 hypothetical protein [Candidatus Omnitrophota bacterium]